jgi:hypothetical protein
METTRARAIAERLHAGHREDDGTPLLRHIERVARSTPAEARAVAWLHEVLEFDAVTEDELVADGLTSDELRAIRLLHRTTDSRSDPVYLAHVDRIARASGRPGRLARMVKRADLEDRRLHPRVRRDGWAPPYTRALQLLRQATDDRRGAVTASAGLDSPTAG